MVMCVHIYLFIDLELLEIVVNHFKNIFQTLFRNISIIRLDLFEYHKKEMKIRIKLIIDYLFHFIKHIYPFVLN